MKIGFYLIVLANVAMLLWEYHNGAFIAAVPRQEQLADNSLEPILLWSEVKTPAPSAAAAPPVAAAVAAVSPLTVVADPSLLQPLTTLSHAYTALANLTLPPEPVQAKAVVLAAPMQEVFEALPPLASVCYEVGPFASQSAYRAFVYRLKASHSAAKPVQRDQQVAYKYMVFYPATDAESKANVAMLKSKGIKDLWPLSGAEQGAISLGLFGKEANALVMQSELQGKGINSQIKVLYKPQIQFYAWLKGTARLTDQLKTLPGLTVTQLTDCQ